MSLNEIAQILQTELSKLKIVSLVQESNIKETLDQVPRWVWITGSLLGAAVCFKVHYDSVFGVWQRQGVPGPKPVPIMGNALITASSEGLHDINSRMAREYGHKGYFGMFNGSTPVLVITDPDLICEVMIKKFDIFPNRASLPGFNPKYLRKAVSLLRDSEWRQVRNILTPTFTGLKLKRMVPLISGVGKHLCEKFEQILETPDQEFQLKPLYRACTMDIIMNIVFGINVDTQAGDNDIANACIRQTVQNEKMFSNPLTVLSLFVPGVGKIVKLFDPSLGLNLEASEVTAKFMLEIMKKKNETQTLEEKTFFLNTLVEKFELHQVTQGKDGIDFESTVAQALIFLLAGFDTTANLLMWTSYYLALHPDVQDQVFEEITSHAGLDGEEANYETVNKMHLLENVLMETLRLRPVFRTQREAVADTTIGPGINIKKGWLVEVAVNVIHNDPKIWGDPEVFRPSRFDPEETKERSPYAFNAFGVGPRNCIGMRLALFEVKMAFVKILSKYKLMRGRDTPDTFTNYLKQQFYDPVEPIFLKVARRH